MALAELRAQDAMLEAMANTRIHDTSSGSDGDFNAARVPFILGDPTVREGDRERMDKLIITHLPKPSTSKSGSQDNESCVCVLHPGVAQRVLAQTGFPRSRQVAERKADYQSGSDVDAEPKSPLRRYETRKSQYSTGGLGLYCRDDDSGFQMGDIIIQEVPLVIIPAKFTMAMDSKGNFIGVTPLTLYQRAWDQMTRTQQNAYASLANCHKNKPGFYHKTDRVGVESQLGNIANTNGLPVAPGLPGDEYEHYTCVTEWISRANHSCSPNSYGVWDPLTFTQTLRAFRPIKPGEEITVSYIGTDISVPSKERKAELMAEYRFDCTCPLCSDAVTSDARRARIMKAVAHRPSFDDWVIDLTIPDDFPIKWCKAILHLMNEERIITGTITLDSIETLAKCYMALGDRKNSKFWIGEMLKLTKTLHELLPDEARKMFEEAQRDPTKTTFWNVRSQLREYASKGEVASEGNGSGKARQDGGRKGKKRA